MATLASLKILLGLDSAGVSSGAGKVRQELGGVQKSANTARDALRGVAAGFGLGVGLSAFNVAKKTVQEFTDLIGDSVKAAIAEEAGIKRLDQSLKANVAGWDGNRAAIEKVIAARQALGFSDDEQRDAMARALVATGDVARAQAVLATAMDLARLKGIDLGSATDALIKIEGGQFRALKALGIELKAGATQQEALAAVQKVAAGQAVEFGKTTAGAMAEANIAIDNLKEDFGNALMPVLADGARFLTSELIPAVQGLAEKFNDIANAAGVAFGPMLKFVDELSHLKSGADANLFSIEGMKAAINDLTPGTFDAAAAGRAFGSEWGTAADKAHVAAVSIREAGEGAVKTALAARDMGDGSREAGEGVAILASDLQRLVDVAAAAPAVFRTAQDAFEQFGTNAPLTAAGQDQLAGVFLDKQRQESERDAQNRQRAEEARRDAQRAADQAAADAKRAAAEAKRLADEAARQAERDAAEAQRLREQGWKDAQDAADQYFDRVHKQNRDAIDDIRDRRNAELDAANAAIQAPVDAERAKLKAMRDAEQEQGLRAAVAGATDPADLAAAQRDLQRFLEDQRVDFMQGRADAEIALNEAARENANAAADMAIAAEALRDIAARASFDPRVTFSNGGTVASVNLADFEGTTTVVQVFVDGKMITEQVDHGLNTRRVNVSPTAVSTGSTR